MIVDASARGQSLTANATSTGLPTVHCSGVGYAAVFIVVAEIVALVARHLVIIFCTFLRRFASHFSSMVGIPRLVHPPRVGRPRLLATSLPLVRGAVRTARTRRVVVVVVTVLGVAPVCPDLVRGVGLGNALRDVKVTDPRISKNRTAAESCVGGRKVANWCIRRQVPVTR